MAPWRVWLISNSSSSTPPSRKPAKNKSPNQLNKSIERGQAPRGIVRVDTPKIKNEKLHVHFDDGSALNIDGTWKHGGRDLTRSQKKWLQDNGWKLPDGN